MNCPILAFYGDDFTGSTDAMEVLQWNGLKTVLFLAPPTEQQLAAFPDLKAFGIAGTSRSMDNACMRQELTSVFERLKACGSTIIHYKTCSTFDSSPEIGNIGLAIEIGRSVVHSSPVIVVVGAPKLGRYQVFGNLFARSGLDTEPYRLDRHPTMSHHPITPMQESDLRLVLSQQTKLATSLIDILAIQSSTAESLLQRIEASNTEIVLMDVVDDQQLMRIGESIDLRMRRHPCQFVVGSSGIEYALVSAWLSRQREQFGAEPRCQPTFPGVDQLLVITGSCSPVNDRQIEWAEKIGFHSICVQTEKLVDHRQAGGEIDRVVELARFELSRGSSVILHSSRGPMDERIENTRIAFQNLGLSDLEIRLTSGRILGPQLGKILKQVLASHPLRRIGIAGGDTSGFIARALDIEALEAIAPLAPGSPLCRVYSQNAMDGVEIIFKGGQVGRNNVWQTLLEGTAQPLSSQRDCIH